MANIAEALKNAFGGNGQTIAEALSALPAVPTEDGTYALKIIIDNGVVYKYVWEKEEDKSVK